MDRHCRRVLVLMIFLCTIVKAAPASLPWHGSRNNYFSIFYHRNQLHAAAVLSRESDSFARKVCGELGLTLPTQPIPVYLDPTAPGRNEVFPSPRWVAGYYEPQPPRIVLKTVHGPGRFLEDELVTVFKHEAIHAIIHDNGIALPRWMEEGLAQVFSRGFTLSDGRQLLGIDPARADRYLTDDAFRSEETARWAYPLSAGLVAYLREQGTANLRLLLDRIPERGLDSAFRSVYGADPPLMMLLFRENFLSRYTLPHLLISDGGTFLLIALFAVVVLVLRRLRSNRKLRAMGEQEQMEFETATGDPVSDDSPADTDRDPPSPLSETDSSANPHEAPQREHPW